MPGVLYSGRDGPYANGMNVCRRYIAGVVGVVMWSGCGGGGDISLTVKKSAAERPDIDRKTAASGALVLPAKTPFNLTSFRSGQDGMARGECQPIGADEAKCRAEARQKGSAWGEFQLGYCFDNASGSVLDAVIKLHLTISHGTEGAPSKDDKPGASSATSLKFFIKDSLSGQMLRTEDLLSSNAESGAAYSTRTQDLVFDARFEPGHGYYLVLTGRAEVQAGPDDKPLNALLNVTHLGMEVNWQGTRQANAERSLPSEKGVGGTAPTNPPR